MKTKYKILLRNLGMMTAGLFLATSCTKYLDVAPQVNITDQDVFGTFPEVPGIYRGLLPVCGRPDPRRGGAECNWNYGLDEGIMAPADQRMLSTKFEQGNYMAWTQSNYSMFAGTTGSPGNTTEWERLLGQRVVWHP